MSTGGGNQLARLRRRDRRALRDLLVGSTAAAARPLLGAELPALLEVAPIAALPAAASMHRVVGSVLRGLRHAGLRPKGVSDELEMLAAGAALGHLRSVGALSVIADAFESAGLAWVVMKGPVLAAHHYPDIGDRVYSDLDLLVDRRDFPEAMRLLERLGYEHDIHNWALAETMLAGQVGLRLGGTRVDLHWHLHYATVDRRPYALDPDAMVARARRVAVSGLTVPTLDPVDTLLTLGFHAARSDGHALVWMKDVERVLEIDRPDLDEFVARCQRARCAPAVGLMMSRSRALLGAEIPRSVIDRLVPRSLLAADHAARRVSHPIQLHDRWTAARWVSRSVGASTGDTVRSVPGRASRKLQRILLPPAEHETDDPVEKASYLQAVRSSGER